MRSFIIKILLAVVIVFVADQVIGAGLMYMRKNAGSGSAKEIEYTTRKCHEDIMVFGSSRAMHHYVPDVIKDSLGLSCFNCGKDGMNIFYNYGRWQLLREHHTPKVVVYDYVDLDHEIKPSANYRFFTELRPYCENKAIMDMFNDVDSSEQIKVHSQLYRNNSKILQLVAGFFKREGFSDGFDPLHGHIKHFYKIRHKKRIDSTKYKYLEKFIQTAQEDGVKVIFMTSPYYDGANGTCPPEIQELFKKYNVDFFNNEDLEGFTRNKEVFRDMRHLNEEGAIAYSKIVAAEIKNSLNH